ncbi:MAG: hypothetical protein RLZZ26_372 [Candidatus Parcubacteria bacterium]|jgi:hypothetical protein
MVIAGSFVPTRCEMTASAVQVKMVESGPESELFKGMQRHDGLSNAKKLEAICPPEFLTADNPWSCYAEAHIGNQPNPTNWQWVDADHERATLQLHVEQRHCLDGILLGSSLARASQRAVGGWMLSRMLRRVPEIMTLA